MYCRNCGAEVSEKAIMCVTCGTPPLSGNKFCYSCKAETNPEAVICVKCGVALKKDAGDGFDWLTTLLLCFFVGCFGAHRFFTKNTAIAVVQLFTLGGCGIWALIDFIMILTGAYTDGQGRKLVKK